MKKFIYFLAVLLVVFTSCVQAANIKETPRIAVLNFGNKAITSSGMREHDFSSASEYATLQLANSGWFKVIDYEQISTIAKMHSISMSGLIDQGTAVQMGRISGAEFIVVGNVTGLTTKENVLGYKYTGKGGISNAQHVVTANVTLRMVDIETGSIVVMGMGSGSSTSTYTELGFNKYRNKNTADYAVENTDSSEDAQAEGGGDSETADEQAESGDTVLANDTEDTVSSESYISSEADAATGSTTGNFSEYDHVITIGTVEVSATQVGNAIRKAVKDAIYGRDGILTILNGGKKVKAKIRF